MRIQILELPLRENEDGKMFTPFIILCSEVPADREEELIDGWSGVEDIAGCKGIFTTDMPVELGPRPQEPEKRQDWFQLLSAAGPHYTGRDA